MDVKREFEKYFELPFELFYDVKFSSLIGAVEIDHFAFAKALEVPPELSLEDEIIARYGNETRDWYVETFLVE